MSSITTDQGIVHYEVYGRGKPVILLHGWLGSWGLWQETMGYLGSYYRTYALDFWGFGESGKKRETYAVQDFVSLVDQFMEQLGIMQAPAGRGTAWVGRSAYQWPFVILNASAKLSLSVRQLLVRRWHFPLNLPDIAPSLSCYLT